MKGFTIQSDLNKNNGNAKSRISIQDLRIALRSYGEGHLTESGATANWSDSYSDAGAMHAVPLRSTGRIAGVAEPLYGNV